MCSNYKCKISVTNKYTLLPQPLFLIIINYGAMKELKKWFKQLQTHIYVVDIY